MTVDVSSQLERLGIRPVKSLGQNFLKDMNIAEKVVESAQISSDEIVLEIGPGLGILTDEIVKKADRTVAVEKDASLVGYLEGKYTEENMDIEIIKGDILEMDIPEIDKVVSNLPFSISSPVTFKLLKEDFKLAVLGYQKEYAERMVAKPGEEGYSRLSVMVSTLAKAEVLFDIPRHAFYPPPSVDATVVRLIPSYPQFPLKHEEAFSRVVKELFNYRRKKIKNALKMGFRTRIGDVPYGDKRVGNLPPKKINQIVNHLVEEELISEDQLE
ncbi:MAG: 16S rRNA (adenine(1518)-N(6)/adenine(1519)-N(6))-dimethyltransferase RsmA [Candidatus Aenigmatarchaeota archaeon]